MPYKRQVGGSNPPPATKENKMAEEKRVKVCPILQAQSGTKEPCLKEHCAWWSEGTKHTGGWGCCCILEISDSLFDMVRA